MLPHLAGWGPRLPQRSHRSVREPAAEMTRRSWTPGGGSAPGIGGAEATSPLADPAPGGRGLPAKRTRCRGKRVGPSAIPAWAQASWASRAAAPTWTAATYMASAASAAALVAGGASAARSAIPARRSASAFPRQSATDRRGGSGRSRCAGTQRAESTPAREASQSLSHKSACFHSGGRGLPRSRITP